MTRHELGFLNFLVALLLEFTSEWKRAQDEIFLFYFFIIYFVLGKTIENIYCKTDSKLIFPLLSQKMCFIN